MSKQEQEQTDERMANARAKIEQLRAEPGAALDPEDSVRLAELVASEAATADRVAQDAAEEERGREVLGGHGDGGLLDKLAARIAGRLVVASEPRLRELEQTRSNLEAKEVLAQVSEAQVPGGAYGTRMPDGSIRWMDGNGNEVDEPAGFEEDAAARQYAMRIARNADADARFAEAEALRRRAQILERGTA